MVETEPTQVITSENQAGIWLAGVTCYAKRQFLPAADLFQLAYQLKPASRISQNIGMAYLKAAQLPEHPEVLRLEYVRRALPQLRSYRLWLTSDYGRLHDITRALAETNQRISEAEHIETELRAILEQPRSHSSLPPGRQH
jgi:hypothetical protein